MSQLPPSGVNSPHGHSGGRPSQIPTPATPQTGNPHPTSLFLIILALH